MKKLIFTAFILACTFSAYAQDDLLDLLNEEQGEQTDYAIATFKGQRLINGHTVVTRKKSELEFLISHRFGRVNSGIKEFFGLDAANVRFSLEYGLTDGITAGIGRNSLQKVYDGFVKYNLLRQSTGKVNMPFTVTGLSSIAIRTADNFDFEDDDFASKVSYTHQILVARKLNEKFSVQISPTFVHRNKILENQANDIFALGFGGRMKLSQRIALNAEYFYRLTDELDSQFNDAIGIGLEIETGGHVFHLNFTNARSMAERAFITETTGDFFNGDIHFGFNISRVF
ncbi:DUF5777 family beta-barrel protein [Roseivirga misakiensis]|uniref:DUF5777 domain-containing protein n=1 Tax=Roseivirga misakiensis TaxID=1563681 RepID=A0A1E5T2I5_9BACT|nr:DUF5777 family beta-barrel protein [Roseivirga misakiensis]OEK05579.1 hypothetical protein BFP71_13670 [Roseivirga misakiensis]